VRDVSAQPEEFVARPPFKVQQEDKRRFIRLEIASPMTLRRIKDVTGGFWTEGEWHVIDGLILNVSAGGVLVDVNQPLMEGDIVSMHFTLQEVECLENIVGLVKRVEEDDGSFLVGIEFISRKEMSDVFSKAEMELLRDSLTDFDEGVRDVLNRFVMSTRQNHESN
jgi:hypothetical protein